MKNSKFTLLTFMLLVVSTIGMAQEKYSRVKFYPTDNKHRIDLLGLLEVDHYMEEPDGGIMAEISAGELKLLAASKTKYKVLIDDVAKDLEEENRKYYEAIKAGADRETYGRSAYSQVGKTVGQIIATPSAFQVWGTLGGYYSFAQMNTAMNNLVATYPTIAQKISLGTSHGGRDIWCIKISDNVATDEPNEPEVLYIGLQHAREAIGGASMIFMMQYLCEQYDDGNELIVDLVDNREIYIIPCMNPDGWEHNRSTNPNGGGGWRKNRRNNGGSFGVDLNRNWGVDWANCAGATASCGSPTTSSDTYWGPSVFSEPETRAIRDFVYTRNFVAMIDQHAYGPYYSLPFGRPSLHTMDPDDQRFYTHIPAAMGFYNGMRAGNSPQAVGYEVAGGVKDWMLMGNIGVGSKGKVYGLTGEGGAANSAFWPPAGQIINLSKGMVYQNIQMAYAAGSYVDIQDVGDLVFTDKWGGDLDFTITRIGLADEPVTVSLVPIENIVSVGSPVVVNSLPGYEDTYTGSVSYTLPWTIQNGHRIKYAWRVETGGYIYYDTVIKFLNPNVLVSDNMEGSLATNWTSGGGWAFSTDDAFQGSRSLTESPGGNYTNNSTRTVTLNTVLNLTTASQTWLTFYTKYRCENFRDKLQVQMSINGGAFTAIPGSGTVQEPGTLDNSTINGQPALTGWNEIWTKQLFDLSAGNGSNNVRIRFEFTSSAASSFFYNVDDGFYIDNLQIISSSIPLQILPVRFLDLRGKLLPNRTIEVSWDAETDEDHDYFEVEKSADGSNFKSIGKVTGGSSPYKLIDNAPFSGNNFYRIKQYDKKGNFNYSTVINVKNVYKGGVQIYPNPLTNTDLLTIRPDGNFNSPVNLRITDAQGRVVYQKFIHDFSQEIKINTAGWSSQIYVLKITNNRGEFVTVEKIMKK